MLGSRVVLSVFTQPTLLLSALVITVFAILGKVLGCGLGALNLGKKEALMVGFGMVPRGEFVMIIAAVGLGMNAISSNLYTVIISMVMVTTLITPPILRKLVSKNPAERNKLLRDNEE